MIKILKNAPIINPNFNFIFKREQKFTNCKIDDDTYVLIEEWINNLGLLIGHCSALVYCVNGQSPLHTDFRNVNNFPKINWIFGGGDLRFFEFINHSPKFTKEITELNLPYNFYHDYNDVRQVGNFKGGGTIMIDAAKPHDVIDINEERYCFSLTPIKRKGRSLKERFLSWDEAKEIFS